MYCKNNLTLKVKKFAIDNTKTLNKTLQK